MVPFPPSGTASLPLYFTRLLTFHSSFRTGSLPLDLILKRLLSCFLSLSVGDILSGLPSLLLGFSSSSVVKNLPATQETLVQFQDQEDPLEKGKATQCSILGLPWWLSWYRICLQCGRPGFDPWVGKIPWRREQLPTPVFWPGEFRGLYRGCKESDTTVLFSLSLSSLVIYFDPELQ